MQELLLDDIFQVIVALVIIAIFSMWLLPPDTSEKVLIGICSGLAGIAKGRESERAKKREYESIIKEKEHHAKTIP